MTLPYSTLYLDNFIISRQLSFEKIYAKRVTKVNNFPLKKSEKLSAHCIYYYVVFTLLFSNIRTSY